VLLRLIRREQVAAIERLRTPTTLAWKRQKYLHLIMPFFNTWQQEIELAEFVAADLYDSVEAKREIYGWADDGSDRLGRGAQWDLVRELDWREVAIESRDEFGAMLEALPDLECLARYEHRARSRLRRATLLFMAIKASRTEANAGV